MAKSKMATGNCIRQGDVLLVRATSAVVTAQHREVPREGGVVVVALGETSGHAHVFRDPGVCMLQAEGISDRVLTVADLCDLVTEGGELAPGMPRHTPVPVAPGTYRVIVQREWSGEEIRNVQD